MLAYMMMNFCGTHSAMRSTPSASSSLPGLTLIEILVSIGILGVMLILFQAVLSGSNLSSFAKNQGLALSVAETKLESLRQGGYAALPASGPFSASDLSLLPGGSGTLSITDYDAATKRVTVTVSWLGHQSTTPFTLSIDTLITKTGGLP